VISVWVAAVVRVGPVGLPLALDAGVLDTFLGQRGDNERFPGFVGYPDTGE